MSTTRPPIDRRSLSAALLALLLLTLAGCGAPGAPDALAERSERERTLGSRPANGDSTQPDAGSDAGSPVDAGQPMAPSPTPVGTIEGTFDVNSMGGASYSMPIPVPPGVLGIEPRLDLSYGSHAENGIAGVGFGLNGLSQITRCAATLAQDGVAGTVNLDQNDKLCLDGMRLIQINGPGRDGQGNPIPGVPYGSDGAIYRTEGETWTQVTSNGACDYLVTPEGFTKPRPVFGPCTLTAQLKNGARATFGASETCARIGTTDSWAPRFSWPLTQIVDVHGNTMQVTYQQGGAGECVPDHIAYGGNPLAGIDNQRLVTFDYSQGRPDQQVHYIAGFRHQLTVLLSHVRTWVKGGQYPGGQQQVRDFRLAYQQGTSTLRSRLASVTECDAANECFPPTAFAWQEGNGFDHHSIYQPEDFAPDPSMSRTLVGDFNGDGKPDYLQLPDSTTDIYTKSSIYLSRNVDGIQLWDQAQGPSMTMPVTGLQPLDFSNRYRMGDFNGDGRTDLLTLRSQSTDNGVSGYLVQFSDATGLHEPGPSAFGGGPSLNDRVWVGDFDGDGRADILTMNDASRLDDPDYAPYTGWRVYQWNGFHFELSQTFSGDFNSASWDNTDGFKKDAPTIYLGDFNGDGRVDFLATSQVADIGNYRQSHGQAFSTEWKLYLSTPTGFVESGSGLWPHANYKVTIGDFNGDGLSDVMLTGTADPALFGVQRQQPGYLLLRSTGLTLVPVINKPIPITLQIWNTPAPITIDWGSTGDAPDFRHAIQVANLDGDGAADILAACDPLTSPNIFDGVRQFRSGDNGLEELAPMPGILATQPFLSGDFGGSGRTSLFRTVESSGVFEHAGVGSEPDLLSSVTNGYGAKVSVFYVPMTFPMAYTKGSGATYPRRDYISSRFVVWETAKTDGHSDAFYNLYTYEGARTDVTGRGFLGFSRITTSSINIDGTLQVTDYNRDWPFNGTVAKQEVQYQGAVIGRSEFQYQDFSQLPGVHDVRVTTETKTSFNLAGWAVSQSQREFQYDAFGNTSLVKDHADLADPKLDLFTASTYQNDQANWRLGYPTLTVVSDVNGKILNQKKVAYDSQLNPQYSGLWDDVNNVWLGTTQTFYPQGQVQSAKDPAAGVTLFQYDSYGLLASITNALNQVSTKKMDPRFGVEVAHTDANNIEFDNVLDGFGRVVSVLGPSPLGGMVEIKRMTWASPGYGFVAQSWERRSWDWNSDWDWKEDWHDGLTRKYRTRRRGKPQQAIVTDAQFQWMDLVHLASKPYYEGETAYWMQTNYDIKRRPITITFPGMLDTNITYDDTQRLSTRTEPLGGVTQQWLNARGKLQTRIDATGATTLFDYDALGRLGKITDAEGNKVVTTFDSVGRKSSVFDSNTGLTTYSYDGAGHLTQEVDGKGQHTLRGWDGLDRTVIKSFHLKSGEQARAISYSYDDPAYTNSTGRLSHAKVWVDQGGTQTLESETDLSYDAYGHQTGANLTIDGRSFAWNKTFDPEGNESASTYPDGSTLNLNYDTAGALHQLLFHDVNDAPGVTTKVGTYDSYNAEGRPGSLAFGNGLIGCFTYSTPQGTIANAHTSSFPAGVQPSCTATRVRQETRLLDLSYVWDAVNRITGIDDKLDPWRQQGFAYNTRGELTFAIGPYGTHQYDWSPAGNLKQKDATSYTSVAHQLRSGTDGTQVTYDPNGNVVSKSAQGSNWAFDWDTQDQLRSVKHDGKTTQYAYDFAGHLIRKIDNDGTVTYHAGTLYDLMITPAGERATRYVDGPQGHLAQLSHTAASMAMMQSRHHQILAGLFNTGTVKGAASHFFWLARSVLDDERVVSTAALALLAALACIAAALFLATLYRARGGARGSLGRRNFLYAVLVPAVAFAFTVTAGFSQISRSEAALQAGAAGPGRPIDGVFYFHQNQVGSTEAMTDKAGAIVNRMAYDPFGNLVDSKSSGPDISRAKFSGKEFDQDAGIYESGARFYDPVLGRFLSADTELGGDPNRSVSFNRYAYAGNNPINYIDPSGHDALFAILFMVAMLLIGGVIGGTNGKILSDSAHAFDNWSWTRAVVGAWIGLVCSVVGFALSSIGTVATIFGTATWGNIAASTFAGGVVSATFAYASGERNAGRLVAYFGIGMLTGFFTGTGGLGLSKALGFGGKLLTDSINSMGTSLLKKAVNNANEIQFTIFALSVTFHKDGTTDSGGSSIGFIAKNILAGISNFGSGGGQAVSDGWSWETMSEKVVNPQSNVFGFLVDKLHDAEDGWQPILTVNFYDLAGGVAAGVLDVGGRYFDREHDPLLGGLFAKLPGLLGDLGKDKFSSTMAANTGASRPGGDFDTAAPKPPAN